MSFYINRVRDIDYYVLNRVYFINDSTDFSAHLLGELFHLCIDRCFSSKDAGTDRGFIVYSGRFESVRFQN